MTYVDSRCKHLEEEIKTGDDNLKAYVDRTIVTFGEDIRELRNYIIYKRIGLYNQLREDSLLKCKEIENIEFIEPIDYTEIKGIALNNIDINTKIN